MKSKLVYWLTYAGMWLLALLPFSGTLYIVRWSLFLMRHVVHYRRKVVRKNLKNSFPENPRLNCARLSVSFIAISATICWKK